MLFCIVMSQRSINYMNVHKTMHINPGSAIKSHLEQVDIQHRFILIYIVLHFKRLGGRYIY